MPIKPVSGEIKAQDINDNISYLDSKTNNISKGSPSGTFATLAELKAKYPSGNNNMYVVTADGKWYYWSGTDWAAGGVYQSQGIADKSIGTNETQEIVMNGAISLSTNDDITFESKSGILNVPAGGFRYGNKIVGFNSHTVDALDISAGVDFLTVYFDTETLKFIILNNTLVPSAPKTAILQGVISKSLNRWYGNPIPLVINGKRSTSLIPNNLQAVLIGFDKDIDFDFVNNQVVIPKITNAATPAKLFSSNQITGGNNELIIKMNATSQEQVLLLNYKTSQLTIRPFANFDKSVLADEMLLAYFSTTFKKVVANFPFTVNGVGKRAGKIGASVFLVGLSKKIDYDFNNREITIPAVSNMWLDNKYYSSAELTGGNELSIQMGGGSELALVFDTLTNSFKCVLTPHINLLKNTDVICSVFSSQYKTVVSNAPYTINGSDPQEAEPWPKYFQDELQELLSRLEIENSRNKLSLAFITDVHNRHDHYKNVIELSKRKAVDILVNGGDLSIEDNFLTQLDTIATKMSAVEVPSFLIRGNHDDTSDYDYSNERFTNRLISNLDFDKVTFPDENADRGYYYYDDNVRKIRVVFTNSSEEENGWAFSAEQIKWLAEVAFNLNGKADWQLLVFGHHHIAEGFSNTKIPTNSGEFIKALKALNEGGTYSNADLGIAEINYEQHKVIAYIHGHTHMDACVKIPEIGFYIVSTLSSLPDYYSENLPEYNQSYPRTRATAADDSWDVFVIDPKINKVKILRFGAGIDREFNY